MINDAVFKQMGSVIYGSLGLNHDINRAHFNTGWLGIKPFAFGAKGGVNLEDFLAAMAARWMVVMISSLH